MRWFKPPTDRLNQIESRLAALERSDHQALTREYVKEMIRDSIHRPLLEAPSLPDSAPFMRYSSCNTSDLFHPRYAQLCKLMNDRPRWHRKQWEYVFIMHHLLEANVLAPGMRGVGFGVGGEPLPCAFANLGAQVLGTDAPTDIKIKGGWENSKEHSASLEQMKFPWIEDRIFYSRVNYAECDMNNIDIASADFDFTWSSCCLEHLGTLQKGLDFIANSVEKCLRIGGIAVHTTELNLSSSLETIDASESTVLYRKQDLDLFVQEMRRRGHQANEILIGPAAHALDFHVDIPPFAQEPHLKLRLAGFVTTSVGVVVRKCV
jgi:Methyltransferase domain